MKSASNIPCKVRRKLFLEEEKSDGLSKIVDGGDTTVISGDDETDAVVDGEEYPVKVLDKDDSVVSSTKAALSNLILIITTFEDSTSNHNMQLLSDQVSCAF